MTIFDVILNKCVDDAFYNDVTCDFCGDLGTVVILPSTGKRICKWCLRKAEVAINRAVLDSCGLDDPSLKGE
jgi:hypothetical protein